MELPLVAIVGAPNVGKSTLFNRLVGARQAIVTDEPGVTRDRQYGEVRDAPTPFRLIDTGGLTPRTAAPFAEEISRQAELALSEASLIVFIVDVRAGATALDREITAMLRHRTVPLILVANKADSEKTEALAHDLHELGLGPPVPTSAEHGRGVDELLERIAEALQTVALPDDVEAPPPSMSVAIVGRPNVGKSSLLNRLVGEERVMVSDIPGTTRDAIDTLLEVDGKRYRLIDTAGIRRRGKVQRGVERFSVARARLNIDRCDVAVLVLDGSEPFAAQDAHIAGYIVDSYKPMVVAVNKWDLVEGREEEAKRWEERVRFRLRFAKEVPMILVSAKTGQRTRRILDRVDEVHACGGIRISTPQLNRWLQEFLGPNETTSARRGMLRLYYAVQTGTHPPRFTMFCNDPRNVHFSMQRRLENGLRTGFGFGAAPLRLQFRRRREDRAR